MRQNLLSAVIGFLFSIGLGISGMTNPQKVISFLDIFGIWDPSLVFVMIGAILVHFVAYSLIRSRNLPCYSSEWHVPASNEITKNLIIGSVLFGAGWGLVGYCPGPAFASLATLTARPLVFVVSMIVGMFFFKFVDKRIHFKR